MKGAKGEAGTVNQTAMDTFGTVRLAVGWGARKDRMPVGAVVVRRHNQGPRTRYCRYIKVQMHGGPQQKWRPYARWWWQKHHGPIPAGKIVLHRDGDELNDNPKNLILGTPGIKLVLAHQRAPGWSREQHRRAAEGCAEFNRRNGRINRAKNFLSGYWYPIVDEMGVILNVPFRRRKRLLACFGIDVTRYPANGHGKKPGSEVQRALTAARVRPARGHELSLPRYGNYCLMEPSSKACTGPMSGSVMQLMAQLERMGVWMAAQEYARKDLSERK
jgi:hypothetical protein